MFVDMFVINIHSTIAQEARPFHLLLTTAISVAVFYMGVKTILGLMKNIRFRKENGMRADGKSQQMVAVSIVIVSTQILKLSLEVFNAAWLSLGHHALLDDSQLIHIWDPAILMYLKTVDVGIFEFVFLISCVLRAKH